jgi:L-rhamnose isomerase
MLDEELKSFPWGGVWEEYCKRCGVPSDASWFASVEEYERNVTSKRI